MRSHSVTCHPAEVSFPPLPQPKLVLDLATPEGCKAELTWSTACLNMHQLLTANISKRVLHATRIFSCRITVTLVENSYYNEYCHPMIVGRPYVILLSFICRGYICQTTSDFPDPRPVPCHKYIIGWVLGQL